MKNLSVTTFIHILFSVAIIILIATFLLFLSWDKNRQKIEEFKRYQLISISFLSRLQRGPSKDELKTMYEELHVKPLSKDQTKIIKTKITKSGKTIFSGGSAAGQVRVFTVGDLNYIYAERMTYNLMLKDNKERNNNFQYAMAIGIFLIVLLLLIYLALLKKIYPLKRLHKQIQKFAEGDIRTRVHYEYDDEIGKIAKSFDEAILYINELSHSKNLFMRNIMHELKTPITKGRIIVEMIEDEETKSVLIRAFERMNELITELGELERVSAKSFEPLFEHVRLGEMISESQNLLMTSNTCVEVNIKDRYLLTDKKLMILVIKNLLDNGMKYGKNKQVRIQTSDDIIEVVSEGEALSNPLSYYIEPFSQEEKRSSGFGLGLYIVNNILERIGKSLDYRYEAGKNIFMIIEKKHKYKT